MIIDSTGASYMLYSLAHGVGHGAVITVVLSEKGWRATTATGPVYLAWSMYDLNVTHASKATLELDSAPTLELAHTCADGLFHEYMMLARRFGFFDCKHFIYAHTFHCQMELGLHYALLSRGDLHYAPSFTR